MNPETTLIRVSLLIVLWGLYFCIHSWTASHGFKEAVYSRWPKSRSSFRLAYNIFSSLTLIPVLLLMLLWRRETIIQWDGISEWVANLIALAAVVMFYHSTRFYDMKHFMGIAAFMAGKSSPAREPFCLSPYHRFVRHPWYFFGLLMLWTRSMDIMQLISTLAVTLYLVIGSTLEERKLVHEFGDKYLRYRKKVPALLPLPWKYLKRDEVL